MNGSFRHVKLSALALLAGAGLAMAGAAHAQDGLSEAFRAQAEQVKAAPSIASAEALAGQAGNPLEKYVAGAIMLQTASGANDLRAERKALNVLFESKGVPAKDLPKLHNQAGVISLMLNDPKDAIAQIRYAEQLGYRDFQGQVALADALARSRDGVASMAALDSARTIQGGDTQAIPESWYDRAIALATSTNQLPNLALWGQRKLVAYPSDRNWRSALMTYVSRPGVGLEETLDIFRLAVARNALVTERDWLGYALAANNAGAFTEAKAALESGVSRGAIPADSAELKKQIALLSVKSKKQLAGLATQSTAAGKSAKGDAAMDVADEYLSSAQFQKAVEFYQMALTKGVADKERATVRLGIAQIRNGDVPGGLSSLALVTSGPWASVSGFWSVPPTTSATASARP